ncbi:MAG: efflux RND transporter periplasmic adaptor subunit [Acidobacteria bacterium]|nr:efflux RND transporter periplasmic adaptor subunit [Acidobacteriota bacterium]
MSDERDRPDSTDDDAREAAQYVRTPDERAADALNAGGPAARGRGAAERVEAERVEAERRRRTVIVAVAAVAVIAVVAVLLILRARKGAEPAAEEKEAAVVSVKVAKAERAPIAAQVSALGTIFPRDTAQVSPKISAQIKQMPLWKNRVVRAGEVIAVLEANDLRAQRGEAAAALNEARASERSTVTGTIPQNTATDEKALRDARAAVDNARRTYERRLALYNAGGISKKDLEASQLDLTRAENELRLAEANVSLRTKSLNPNDRAQAAARVGQAEQHVGALDAQLGYSTVRAPISGVVIDQALYEGSFIASGTTLVTIADTTEVIVKAPFADTVAAQLKTGDAATVQPTDLPGEQMTGQVTLISRAVDPASRTVEVWVTLGNGAGRLRVNGAAQVTVAANAKSDSVVVPASAVTLEASNGDEGTVMVVDDASVAHETKVRVGIRAGDKTEILSGLEGGETVVVEGNFSLPDGTKVEVSEGDDEEKGAEKKSDEEKKSGDEEKGGGKEKSNDNAGKGDASKKGDEK